MDLKTVFTKTAKGVTQVNQKTQSLSKDLMKVLKVIDGKSTVDELADKADIASSAVEKLLTQLQKDGFAKIFEVRHRGALRQKIRTQYRGDCFDILLRDILPAVRNDLHHIAPIFSRLASIHAASSVWSIHSALLSLE